MHLVFLFVRVCTEQETGETEDALSMIARLWTDIHLEMSLAGMVLNIIHSTANGPSELAAFSVDAVELGKPAGTSRIAFTVWHFQVQSTGECGSKEVER